MLIRSAEQGGAPTYRAADVAYLVDKLDRGFDRAIYVLGADHHATAQVVRGDRADARLRPRRGSRCCCTSSCISRAAARRRRCRSARGNVVFLDDFMDEVGVDAARWYLVNRGPDQTIEIDLDLAAEKSQKNPVYYVQYAHARIAGDPAQRRGSGGRRLAAGRRSPPRRRS